MSDKIIKERGLITTTLPTQWDFEFDKTTRKMELLNYFQFCTTRNLITVIGEQSRTALILKFYNYRSLNLLGVTQGYGEQGYGESGYGFDQLTKGGYGYSGYGEVGYAVSSYNEGGYGLSGYGEMGFAQGPTITGGLEFEDFVTTGYGESGYGEGGLGQFDNKGLVGQRTDWRLAMRDFLQLAIPSGETDLNELWIAYFDKYSSTPDDANVTYSNLSMESAYRKFLSQHVGGNSQYYPIFTDQVLFSEISQFKFTKRFVDDAYLADVALILLGKIAAFTDSLEMQDEFYPKLTSSYQDYYELLDQANFFVGKGFFDIATLSEIFAAVKKMTRVFNDSVTVSDSLRIKHYPRFSDAVSPVDALALRYKNTSTDSVTMVDSFDKINFTSRYLDYALLEEDVDFVLTP